MEASSLFGPLIPTLLPPGEGAKRVTFLLVQHQYLSRQRPPALDNFFPASNIQAAPLDLVNLKLVLW